MAPLNSDVFNYFRVLITTVDKSTTALPLVFFNNCFDDKNFNNGKLFTTT